MASSNTPKSTTTTKTQASGPATTDNADTAAKATTTSTEDKVTVADNATDLPTNTEAAANEARTGEPGDELQDVNPATTPGDNLAAGATLTENPAGLPASGTGFHCGICGQPISSTGEHYDGNGDVVSQPHANTMVVADDWPAVQAEQDKQAAEEYQARRTAKSRTKSTDNVK